MAGSRLEKIGTIFTRNSGLLQSGALKWEDRPLWYDVYEAFPPFDIPKFNRTVPNIKLRHICYKEDTIRTIIHRSKYVDTVNLLTTNVHKSLTQRFGERYIKENSFYDKNYSRQELYQKVIEFLKQEKSVKDSKYGHTKLSTTFKQGQDKSINLNVLALCK